MKQFLLTIYGIIALHAFCMGQPNNNSPQSSAVNDTDEAFFTVTRATESIKLDGNLSEDVWTSTNFANNFQQFFPSDSIKAQQKTEIIKKSWVHNARVLSSSQDQVTKN